MAHRAFSISAVDIAAERDRTGGDYDRFDFGNILKPDMLELRPMGLHDVHLKILAISGEHNVDHAILADTVNIADLRGGKIYPGNSAIGEVLAVGSEVTYVKPGEIVVTHCNGEPDIYGYPLRIWAYDQPESVGWYGEEAMVADWQVIRAPLECGLSLWELAALPLRAPPAHHLWRRALGIYRLKVDKVQRDKLNVLSFGGGVGELFCMLAKHEGHRVFFCSGSPERREFLATMGIEPIDQKQFNRFASRDDVKAFGGLVKKLVGADGMHIVCDMLRGPVFDAGIAVAAREGVNVSAGWQLARECTYNSATLSVKQVTLDHMHYETIDGCHAATELYGSVFRPGLHKEIYTLSDLPRCMHEMYLNVQTGIPIVRVAEELPEVVRSIS